MGYLTTDLKFILGLKQQKFRVGSLHLNDWILFLLYLQVATDDEVLCLRLTPQRKRLVACADVYRPFLVLAFSTGQLSILCWDALQHLQDCGLPHCHLCDLPQLLQGGREGVLYALGSAMENLPATNTSFQLPSFDQFMKDLDWKRMKTCIQK